MSADFQTRHDIAIINMFYTFDKYMYLDRIANLRALKMQFYIEYTFLRDIICNYN